MDKKFKQDKGVAGLTILLSLIVMLFVIGLLVMIFAIMGSKLQDSTYTTTTKLAENESNARPTATGITLTGGTLRGGTCGNLITVWNGTTGSVNLINHTGNFTQVGCLISNKTVTQLGLSATLRYTYSYTYEADNTATDVMNATTGSVSGVTDWFDIFIVIGAMVVLILLTVIIITAIRSSGMVAGGETANPNRVGSA